AAGCWGGGFLVAALGVRLHWIALIYLGYGVIGGCGLGLGYVSPVSTLIKWFPDRRGMATGMAIMGFGGGALIAAPLSDALMGRFASPSSVGVAPTFVVMGLVYFVALLAGALAFRIPPPHWTPAGWTPPASRQAHVARGHVHVDKAVRTPQFALLWAVLCLNVTAGIGVLGQASPMIQEIFKGRVSASAAAGFVGLLSLFQIERGVVKADAYNLTMYIMTGILLLGFLCNFAIRRVSERHYMTPHELEAEQSLLRRSAAGAAASAAPADAPTAGTMPPARLLMAAIAWLLVGAPLAWGIGSTLRKALQL